VDASLVDKESACRVMDVETFAGYPVVLKSQGPRHPIRRGGRGIMLQSGIVIESDEPMSIYSNLLGLFHYIFLLSLIGESIFSFETE
jgi:hypothetical protein